MSLALHGLLGAGALLQAVGMLLFTALAAWRCWLAAGPRGSPMRRWRG